MGRILFKQFYTTFVEQCFHVVVRKWAHTGLPRKWYEFSTNWIAGLSEEDRAFIHFVFGSDFYSTTEGLSCYNPSEDYGIKRKEECAYEVQRTLHRVGGAFLPHGSTTH